MRGNHPKVVCPKAQLHSTVRCFTWSGGAPVRASASQSIDMDSIPLSSHTKDVKFDTCSSPVWRSTIGGMWMVKHETEFTQAMSFDGLSARLLLATLATTASRGWQHHEHGYVTIAPENGTLRSRQWLSLRQEPQRQHNHKK